MNEKLLKLMRALDSALFRLEDVLKQPANEYMRDSALQRFEFTFELFWKNLKGVSDFSGNPVFSPRDALRSAFQLGLIADDPEWFKMLEDRNLTSHAYQEAIAQLIYSHLPKYLRMMQEVFAELKKRLEP